MRLLPVFALMIATAAAAQTAPHFDGNEWWDTVKFLADDRLEGRETGSKGERLAQEFIVRKLQEIGAEPAGSNGFYQPVKLRSRQIDEHNSSVALIVHGQAQPLTFGKQMILSARVALAPTIEAPLVFAGYGIDVPSMNYSDLAGVDLKGKIAVYFQASPQNVPAALAAHHQQIGVRWKALKSAGAIGFIALPNPESMDIPWSRIALNRSHPSMYLVGEEFDETAGADIAVTYNPAHAEELFQGSGHTFAEIEAIGKQRGAMPHFALKVALRAKTHLAIRAIESNNVVARMPGRDASLRDQYVALSAHIDHIGIGEPINGDRINNGAMDNASGSALLLDVARALSQKSATFGRSVLFIWVTGEEKGLLGSKYFAAHPTVPVTSMVADINTDEFLPIVPFKVLTVYGLAESDLGDRLQKIMAGSGIKVQADQEPLRNIFIRSDQYNFVRRGIPSLMMAVGFEPGTPEENVFQAWLRDRYHAPSDDTNQPVDLVAAARFERVVYDLTVAVANDPVPPAWKSDSFFRRFAEPAKAAQ